MNNIIPFNFEGQAVRSTIIDEEPWFVATDLAICLEYRDAKNAIRYLDADEKGTLKKSTHGGNQDLLIVNESGLYSLIFKSKKAAAKRFKKWVTSEVLPAIRKTGGYGAIPTNNDRYDNLKQEYETLRTDHSDVLNRFMKTQEMLLHNIFDNQKNVEKQHIIESLVINTKMSDSEIAVSLNDDDFYVTYIRKCMGKYY